MLLLAAVALFGLWRGEFHFYTTLITMSFAVVVNAYWSIIWVDCPGIRRLLAAGVFVAKNNVAAILVNVTIPMPFLALVISA